MAEIDLSKQLLPKTLVREALRQPLRVFLAIRGENPLLLVTLTDIKDELAAGLFALAWGTKGDGEAQADGLGYHTVQRSQGADRDVFVAKPTAAGSVADDLRQRILAEPHFVVPLAKRSEEESFAYRISVGRARNTDIVLRDASISKFHAWFEQEEDGSLCVADAGSKNGTSLNGRNLQPREFTRLQEGDKIRFGNVNATVCAPETLWEVINAHS